MSACWCDSSLRSEQPQHPFSEESSSAFVHLDIGTYQASLGFAVVGGKGCRSCPACSQGLLRELGCRHPRQCPVSVDMSGTTAFPGIFDFSPLLVGRNPDARKGHKTQSWTICSIL
ncbi:unnamed protein product [Effrenium voratum]|uniref:Uncharacterized protein n=1 Tax=Effrenium voratum TaxID=2562239 RepID=A0AA36NJL7_9DINO|nr:unnamed protein product [Effrenium voratum]